MEEIKYVLIERDGELYSFSGDDELFGVVTEDENGELSFAKFKGEDVF